MIIHLDRENSLWYQRCLLSPNGRRSESAERESWADGIHHEADVLSARETDST